ncbi:MAG: hypothetical protein J2P57_08235 [Acidimicrobiaceae bacterium]|nr:hypothetical protein [Acidimicrobiaceae bacterium]
MDTAAKVVAVVAGAVIVALTLSSAVRATILPRGVQNRLARLSTLAVQVAFRLRAGESASYERRDRLMAMLGPSALLLLLASWLVSIVIGYFLIYLGVASSSPRKAIELSGSSVFTLGTTSSPRLGANLISYTEAALGLVLLTLMISYLPSIYAAFSRREQGVSLMRTRAGEPPRPATMLIRYQRIEGARYRLTELWRTWEAWFADVEQTHTTFPQLVFFRSPQPWESWVNAAGCLLDAAAFWAACVEHPKDPDVQLCIRAGFQMLQRVAAGFDVPFDPDPAPDDPISVGRDEWEPVMQELADAGMELIADRDQAWQDWKGWRVNYDTVLLNLARLVEAPPAPWLSDRSPIGPDRRWSLRRDMRAALPRGRGLGR